MENYTYPFVSDDFTERGDILNELYELMHPEFIATLDDMRRLEKEWDECSKYEAERNVVFNNEDWSRKFVLFTNDIFYHFYPAEDREPHYTTPRKKRRRPKLKTGHTNYTEFYRDLDHYNAGLRGVIEPQITDKKYKK